MYCPSDLPFKLACLTVHGSTVPPEGEMERICEYVRMRRLIWENCEDEKYKRQIGIACGFVEFGGVKER